MRRRVIDDEEFARIFNGIHRFVFEDLLVLRPDLSRNKARLLSKELAYGVIQRSNAWSGLVESRLPVRTIRALRVTVWPLSLARTPARLDTEV